MDIIQIDLKTGKVLQQTNPETFTLESKIKSVEHSYLETWLNHHELNDGQKQIKDSLKDLQKASTVLDTVDKDEKAISSEFNAYCGVDKK